MCYGESADNFLLSLVDNNIKSKLILSADDTSLIVTNPNPIEFINDINVIIKNINVCFKSNLLSLNPDKTNFMHFY